jgi:hypothetical protein
MWTMREVYTRMLHVFAVIDAANREKNNGVLDTDLAPCRTCLYACNYDCDAHVLPNLDGTCSRYREDCDGLS